MKKIFYPLVAGVLLVTSAFVSVVQTEWKIKDDFSIKFISKSKRRIKSYIVIIIIFYFNKKQKLLK